MSVAPSQASLHLSGHGPCLQAKSPESQDFTDDEVSCGARLGLVFSTVWRCPNDSIAFGPCTLLTPSTTSPQKVAEEGKSRIWGNLGWWNSMIWPDKRIDILSKTWCPFLTLSNFFVFLAWFLQVCIDFRHETIFGLLAPKKLSRWFA